MYADPFPPRFLLSSLDSDYQNFLASIAEKKSDPSKDATEKSDAQLMAHLTASTTSLSLEAQQARAKSTPLLEYLRAQNLEKKAIQIQSRAPKSKNGKEKMTRKEALSLANNQIQAATNAATAPSSSKEKGKKKLETGGSNRAWTQAVASVGNSGQVKKEKEKERKNRDKKEKEKEKGKGKAMDESKSGTPSSDLASSSTNAGGGNTNDQNQNIPKGPRKDKEKSSKSSQQARNPKSSATSVSQPIAILKRDPPTAQTQAQAQSQLQSQPSSSAATSSTPKPPSGPSGSVPTGPKNPKNSNGNGGQPPSGPKAGTRGRGRGGGGGTKESKDQGGQAKKS